MPVLADVNTGVTPPNFASPTGQFRVLLGDTDAVPLDPPTPGLGEYMWFSDLEVNALIGLYNGNVKRAAARALLTIAASQALMLKKWRTDDLQVDGPAIAETLRRQAAQLQDEAETEERNSDIFALSYPGGQNCGCSGELAEGLWPWGCACDADGSSGDDTVNWVVNNDGYMVNG